MKGKKGEFYITLDDDFQRVFIQVIENPFEGKLKVKAVQNQQTFEIYPSELQQISITEELVKELGFRKNKMGNLCLYPTDYFWGEGFKGCCNPMFGYQFFEESEREERTQTMYELLKKAKSYYTNEVDLNYDYDEFIRKELKAIYTVNELFSVLIENGQTIKSPHKLILKMAKREKSKKIKWFRPAHFMNLILRGL